MKKHKFWPRIRNFIPKIHTAVWLTFGSIVGSPFIENA